MNGYENGRKLLMKEPNQLFQESLLKKLDAQTEAMHRLTNSVEALIAALADDDANDVVPSTYMDGSPR
ncbi:MAG: hypothetical protein ACTJH7_02560 [Alcaligenes sp.]